MRKALLHAVAMRGEGLWWGWRLWQDRCVLTSDLAKAAMRVSTADGGACMTPVTSIFSVSRQSLDHLLLEFDAW